MFYTYLWLRENGSPYYVGKGSGYRAFNPAGHRCKVPPRDRVIIQEFETEEDSLFAEMFLIAAYGRLDNTTGCLANLTDGGQNPPARLGFKHSEKTKEQMSKSRKGFQQFLGHHQSDHQKARMKEVHTGRLVSEETKKRMSEAQKGHAVSEESKKNMRAAKLGTNNPNYPKHRKATTEETKEKLRVAQRARRQREQEITCYFVQTVG